MKFTREQLSIIEAPESKILVNASAGTGKTFTLIGAAERVMREQKNSQVAIFTFTRDAAAEIKERLMILPVFVGTIHGFALREIEKMEEKNLLISEIMSEDKMKRLLLNSYIKFYPVRRGYRKEVSDLFRYLTERDYRPDFKLISRYNMVLDDYKKEKERLELYDFTDAPEYFFKKSKELKYETDFTHLFVDEVQDIDLWEYKIISDFKKNVFAIGDPRQSIYQFRNSITQTFDKLEKMGYNLYVLSKNFRSYEEILKLAEAPLEAERGSGGVITDTALLEEEGTVILCRYNFEVRALEPYFEEVRTIHSYKGLENNKIFLVSFDGDKEEDKNLRFVAITRARDKFGTGTFQETLEKGRKIKYGF